MYTVQWAYCTLEKYTVQLAYCTIEKYCTNCTLYIYSLIISAIILSTLFTVVLYYLRRPVQIYIYYLLLEIKLLNIYFLNTNLLSIIGFFYKFLSQKSLFGVFLTKETKHLPKIFPIFKFLIDILIKSYVYHFKSRRRIEN